MQRNENIIRYITFDYQFNYHVDWIAEWEKNEWSEQRVPLQRSFASWPEHGEDKRKKLFEIHFDWALKAAKALKPSDVERSQTFAPVGTRFAPVRAWTELGEFCFLSICNVLLCLHCAVILCLYCIVLYCIVVFVLFVVVFYVILWFVLFAQFSLHYGVTSIKMNSLFSLGFRFHCFHCFHCFHLVLDFIVFTSLFSLFSFLHLVLDFTSLSLDVYH